SACPPGARRGGHRIDHRMSAAILGCGATDRRLRRPASGREFRGYFRAWRDTPYPSGQNLLFCRRHRVARPVARPRRSTGYFAGCMPMFHGSSSSGPSFHGRVDRLARAAEIRREQEGVDLGHHFYGVAEEHCDLLDLYVGLGEPRGERVTQAEERESVAAAAVLDPRSLECGAGPIELRGERERLVLSGQADEVA